jgi:hypothetical protein
MGSKNKNKFSINMKKKGVSAVVFDEKERHEYLKSMFGAKQRRKKIYKKRVEE